MRVLVVEDSRRLRQAVTTGLRRSGYAVDTAENGEEGLWYAESFEYDVIVLDLMLPKMDGLEVLRRLRESGRNVHVLILTARDTIDNRVEGLNTGADDYLVKPFDFAELRARIQALVRRGYGVKSPVIRVGDLEIDTASCTVTRRGEAIALTPREYSLLEFLALQAGNVVSRADIEAHIYDERVEPLSNVVDAAVYALRRKLDTPGSSPLIQTRRGLGYVLEGGKP